MKTLREMNPRIVLSAILITLGLIIAAVPENTTKPYKLTANELLQELISETQFLHPDQVADLTINKDPSIRLIDVRSKDEFDKFSLTGAINIPLDDFLSDEWIDILDQDIMMNVFYSNGTTKSNEAWMLTRQLGYENNYVLKGGLNYWVETIINPLPPLNTSPDDEIAKYDFRKGAGQALGTSTVTTDQVAKRTIKPVIRPKSKKKKVQGGC